MGSEKERRRALVSSDGRLYVLYALLRVTIWSCCAVVELVSPLSTPVIDSPP